MSDKIIFKDNKHKFFYFRKCVENWKLKKYTKLNSNPKDLPDKKYVRIITNDFKVYMGVLEYFDDDKFSLFNPYSENNDKDRIKLSYDLLKPNNTKLEDHETDEELIGYNREFIPKLNKMVGVYINKSTLNK